MKKERRRGPRENYKGRKDGEIEKCINNDPGHEDGRRK